MFQGLVEGLWQRPWLFPLSILSFRNNRIEAEPRAAWNKDHISWPLLEQNSSTVVPRAQNEVDS